MTRTEELLALAEAAHAKGCETEMHLGYDGKIAGSYVVLIRNDIFKQLVELCRLQHEALEIVAGYSSEITEAIAAFNKFDKGGE